MKAWSGLCWIYLLNTSYSEFALLQKVFPLYTDLQLLFMTFFYEAIPVVNCYVCVLSICR